MIKKIESVERPTEKAGRDSVPLLRSREHVAFPRLPAGLRRRMRPFRADPFAPA
jgi:hypothetical protein